MMKRQRRRRGRICWRTVAGDLAPRTLSHDFLTSWWHGQSVFAWHVQMWLRAVPPRHKPYTMNVWSCPRPRLSYSRKYVYCLELCKDHSFNFHLLIAVRGFEFRLSCCCNLSSACHMPHLSHPSWLVTLIVGWRGLQIAVFLMH
jgi:hypothetical protein